MTILQLNKIAKATFFNLVKAVVDIEKQIVAIDSPLHSDLEAHLIEHGSKQSNLWGINLHPDSYGTDSFVEFDSMINLRPTQNNPSRDILDPNIRIKIINLVSQYFTND